MSKLTLKQHIERIKEIRDNLDLDREVYLAANSTLGEVSERIFTNGETITGTQYSYNDENEMYVYPYTTTTKKNKIAPAIFGNTSSLKPPSGKYGDTHFKSGKAHVTTWVESYKDLKDKVGSGGSFVNFIAYGDLKSDIENNGTNTTRKIANERYKISAEYPVNQKKLEGLMKKYPGVFDISESEKEFYQIIFKEEVFAKLNQLLGND